MKPRAIILDADIRAREHLSSLLSEVALVELVGEAGGGTDAVRMLDALRPDVAFLDLGTPVRSGAGAIRPRAPAPVVIFTSVEGDRGLGVLELAGMLTLPKPARVRRVRTVLERAVRGLEERKDEDESAGGSAEHPLHTGKRGELDRLLLRDKDGIVPVVVERITRFEADGDYVIVHVHNRRHLVRMRLRDLEERVGERFMRVHRSHLVNLDHVRVFEQHEDGRLAAVMDDGSRVVASRARSRELRRRAN